MSAEMKCRCGWVMASDDVHEVIAASARHDEACVGCLSPDCRDGNHAKCDGDGMSSFDEIVDCECPCHGEDNP